MRGRAKPKWSTRDPANRYVSTASTVNNNLNNMAALFTQVAPSQPGPDGQSHASSSPKFSPIRSFQQIGLRDGDC